MTEPDYLSAHQNDAPMTLADIRANRTQSRDNSEDGFDLGCLDSLALSIAEGVGTMGFFLLICAWTVCWLIWNLLAPRSMQFEAPMAFVLWLFIANFIQILLLPLIILGQNIEAQRSAWRSRKLLETNSRDDNELDAILRHLEIQDAKLSHLIKWSEKWDHLEKEAALPDLPLPATVGAREKSSVKAASKPAKARVRKKARRRFIVDKA
jgi:uncharacterized membrane protein